MPYTPMFELKHHRIANWFQYIFMQPVLRRSQKIQNDVIKFFFAVEKRASQKKQTIINTTFGFDAAFPKLY
jgi:hypothetical protein